MCIILACVMGCNTAKAQGFSKNGKTFTTTSLSGSYESNDIKTQYFWEDRNGEKHSIFLHKFTKGEKSGQWGCYVIRKSNKTQKEYKYYFPSNEEVAKVIIKEMGIK